MFYRVYLIASLFIARSSHCVIKSFGKAKVINALRSKQSTQGLSLQSSGKTKFHVECFNGGRCVYADLLASSWVHVVSAEALRASDKSVGHIQEDIGEIGLILYFLIDIFCHKNFTILQSMIFTSLHSADKTCSHGPDPIA